MKNLLKITALGLFSLAGLACSPNVSQKQYDSNNNPVYAKRAVKLTPQTFQDIHCGEEVNLRVKKGTVSWFKFVPSSTGYYAVETLGNQATQLCIDLPSGKRVFDSGAEQNGINSKIIFKANANQTIKIYSKLVKDTPSSSYITYDLSLRKQTFNTFTFKKATDSNGHSIYNITTTHCNTKPESLFNNTMDYHNYVNFNSTFSGANEIGYLNYERFFNSEYLFFAGHGGCSGIQFAYGQEFTCPLAIDMRHVRVALIQGCNTGTPRDEHTIPSFAANVIEKGAKCVISFKKTIYAQTIDLFSDRFYEKFSTGATVKESVEYAKSHFFSWSELRSAFILGDDTIRIDDTTKSNGSFSLDLHELPDPGVIGTLEKNK